MALEILTGEAIFDSVSMEACIDLMAETMRGVSGGEARLPARSVVALDDAGNLLLDMPGAIDRPAVFGSKLLSYFPANSTLPMIQGVIILFEASTGRPVAVIDAVSVTALRTAAASGMATCLLAREDASTLAILGTGVQAEHHLRAMRAVRPLERVLIWGRSREKAQAFAKRHRESAGIEIVAVPHARSAVEPADIVCTTTASPTPVLEGRWLKPGAHLNLVGAFTPTTREADTEAIRRSRLFVEIREFALREAGEIGEVVAGKVAGRTGPDEITAPTSRWETSRRTARRRRTRSKRRVAGAFPA